MSNLHIIDIAVIAIYLILCLVIGLQKAGKIKTIREYSLGTGYVSTTVLFFTLFSTHIGAGSTVGAVGKLHTMGLIFAVALMTEPLFWFLTSKMFSKNIGLFKKAGCMTVSDIMGFLYGKPGKWVTNIFSILCSIGMIALQIGAIGYLFNYFLGISHAAGVFIGFGVLVVYSLFGGIRAVSITDTFQGVILLVAIPVACTIAFHDVGGYDRLMAELPSTHLAIDLTPSNILLLSSMIFYSLVPVSAGTFMQRFLMANDSKQLSRTLIILSFALLPFILVICLIGFVMKIKEPSVDPDTAFFYLISHYLPVGVTGLLISGILAAIMSTADSWLNTTSVLCAHDIAKGIFPKLTDKQELFIARISVLVISALSVTLALAATSLMELVWLADNFWTPVILIPLVAGFFKLRTNQKSFISSCTLGIGGALFGRYITGEFATTSLLFGTIGSAIGLLGMHNWQVYRKQPVGDDIPSQYPELEDSYS
jgi:Na+/proline symporter